MHPVNRSNSSDAERRRATLEYKLPLEPVNWGTSCLAVGLGALFFAFGVAMILTLGWRLPLGAAAMWSGLLLICLGKHAPSRPVSLSPNSCVISCLSICLDFLGYPWDVEHLELKLRLNQSTKGTRLRNLLSFLASHGVPHKAFACQSSAELCDILNSSGAPSIAIIRRPILADPEGWGIVTAPLRTIAFWLGKRRSPTVHHAVVVHGMDGERVRVYDPAHGTRHRVRWEWLSERLVADVFRGGPFFIVLRQAGEE